MEGKSMVKLSHMVAFLLLASMFQPLMARYVSDEIELLRFPAAKENQEKPVPDFCTGKHSWPELVGKTVWFAKKTIEKENPAALVVIVPSGGFVIQNYVCGRVFVSASRNLIVDRTPTMEVCCWTQA